MRDVCKSVFVRKHGLQGIPAPPGRAVWEGQMADEGVRNQNTPSIDSHPGGATSLQSLRDPLLDRLRSSVGEPFFQATAPGIVETSGAS